MFQKAHSPRPPRLDIARRLGTCDAEAGVEWRLGVEAWSRGQGCVDQTILNSLESAEVLRPPPPPPQPHPSPWQKSTQISQSPNRNAWSVPAQCTHHACSVRTRGMHGECTRCTWCTVRALCMCGAYKMHVQGGGGWWAVNLVWEIWRFNLASKLPTPNPGASCFVLLSPCAYGATLIPPPTLLRYNGGFCNTHMLTPQREHPALRHKPGGCCGVTPQPPPLPGLPGPPPDIAPPSPSRPSQPACLDLLSQDC